WIRRFSVILGAAVVALGGMTANAEPADMTPPASAPEPLPAAKAEQPPAPQPVAAPWALDLSVGGGASFAKSEALEREHMGSPGTILFGVEGTARGLLRAQLGVGFAFAQDNATITQTVCTIRDMNCSDVDSHVWGAMLWAEIGPQYRYRIPKDNPAQVAESDSSIAAGVSLGYRGLWMERRVAGTNCGDCYQSGLDITGGPYIAPAVTYYPWVVP